MNSAPKPAAFLSYVHSDDDHDRGRITQIRQRLEGEVRMHMGTPFKIFQDRNDLEWGNNWQDRIEESLDNVIFLIPIVTPSYFNSAACRSEFDRFLQREKSLGTNQLIFPLYYLGCHQMDDVENTDSIGKILRTRQYADWRSLRFNSLDSAEVAKQLATMAKDIRDRSISLSEVFAASAAATEDHSPMQPVSSGQVPSISPATYLGRTQRWLPRLHEGVRTASLDRIEEITRSSSAYKIYTAKFDEIVAAETLLNDQSSTHRFRTISNLSERIEKDNARSIQIFQSELSKWSRKRSPEIVLLLDNSGSMRGSPITMLAAWILVIVRIFEEAGIPLKVIGYTTRAWKGGQSRELWLKDGKPQHPGRLNDIRYIVYKDFDDSLLSTSQNFSVMLQEGILKENVDGEALLLAREELQERVTDQGGIIIMSDGAPVDDSTLSVNRAGYLVDHLCTVIEDIKKSDVKLMAIGLDHDVAHYYGSAGLASSLDEIGVTLFKLFRKAFGLRNSSSGKS